MAPLLDTRFGDDETYVEPGSGAETNIRFDRIEQWFEQCNVLQEAMQLTAFEQGDVERADCLDD